MLGKWRSSSSRTGSSFFGSHAYGQPHADSDVDILVVMPARNQIDQALRIDRAIDAPFPLDLIVRTPHAMSWRLKEGDSFLKEIIGKGKYSMKKLTSEWVRKTEADYRLARKLRRGKQPFHDQLCFHCQQAAEKLLKAILEEAGDAVPRNACA